MNIFLSVQKIYTWAEQSNLYNWTAKDDRKSSLFLSNLKIHQATYKQASLNKRSVKVASKCAEKVDQIQSVIDPFKLSSTVWASKLTALGFRRQSLVLQRS